MKGKLIKELHEMGVRKGVKSTGALVSLSHLKTTELINLYYEVKTRNNLIFL